MPPTKRGSRARCRRSRRRACRGGQTWRPTSGWTGSGERPSGCRRGGCGGASASQSRTCEAGCASQLEHSSRDARAGEGQQDAPGEEERRVVSGRASCAARAGTATVECSIGRESGGLEERVAVARAGSARRRRAGEGEGRRAASCERGRGRVNPMARCCDGSRRDGRTRSAGRAQLVDGRVLAVVGGRVGTGRARGEGEGRGGARCLASGLAVEVHGVHRAGAASRWVGEDESERANARSRGRTESRSVASARVLLPCTASSRLPSQRC